MNKSIKTFLLGTALSIAASFLIACSDSSSTEPMVENPKADPSSYANVSKEKLSKINELLGASEENCESDEECEDAEIAYPHSAITIRRSKGSDPSIATYDFCYAKAELKNGDKDTVETQVCFDEPEVKNLDIRFYLVQGTDDSAVEKGFVLETGFVHFGGIDLTSVSPVKINKTLVKLDSAGRYTLFVEVDGTLKKVESFRIAE